MIFMSVTHLIALTTLSCPLFQLEQSSHWTQSRADSQWGSDSYFPLEIFPSERTVFDKFKYHFAAT